MDFIRKVYELKIERELRKGGRFPGHIMIVTTSKELFSTRGLKKLREFLGWIRKAGIRELTVCASVDGLKGEIENAIYEIEKILKTGRISIHLPGDTRKFEKGDGPEINIVMGVGGRIELVEAIKSILDDIERRDLRIEDINDRTITSKLRISSPPDLILRAGARLADFLIWQSIYSELYFLDVKWSEMRYIDFLRAIREYQRRERRYGK